MPESGRTRCEDDSGAHRRAREGHAEIRVGGLETSWTETYRFFRFAKAFSVVTEVKGKGLAVLLKNQTLAPYRKSKSGGQDSP